MQIRRFTTTRVDEAEHAASVGMNFLSRLNSPEIQEIPKYSGAASTSQENPSCSIVQNNKNEKITTKVSSDRAPVTQGFDLENDNK